MMGVGVCVLRVSGDVGSFRRVSGVVCTFRWLNEQKNLNNLGIRLANCQNLFGKIDFHYSGKVTHPSAIITPHEYAKQCRG